MTTALREALKEYGRSIGLAAVGVCAAESFAVEAALLQERQALGYRSEFEEPDIARRRDPQQWLPGAQSIIAVAIGYHQPESEPPPDGPRGWLSRYCRGRDYHWVLHRKLEKLMAWLDEHAPGGSHVPFVDTGPPIDRAVAVRAGLGWFGKSNLLITREHGTYVFLGEIITTLAIAPDTPWHGTCGECTRCLEACPTGALTDAFTMHSDLCLSYVTQIHDWVPEGHREVMDNKLFGCDTCQAVCPYNKAPLPGSAELQAYAEPGATPLLADVLAMPPGRFKRWFLPTAAGWRGKAVLQRNAAIGLGNRGGADALPALVTALKDNRPVLRGHAAWAIGRLAGRHPALAKSAVLALRAARRDEEHPRVCQEIDAALARLPQPPQKRRSQRSV